MGLAHPVAQVEGQFVEAALLSLDHGYLGVLPQAFDAVGGDVVGGIDLAPLKGGHHRLVVGEDAEDDGVDRGPAPPIVVVRPQPEELVRSVLFEHERPAAHPVVAGDVRRVAVGGRLLPDVPGQDVGVHGGESRIGLGGDDLHGEVVEGGGGEVPGRRRVVEPLLLGRGVDRPGDVVGGERLAVRPEQALAQGVGDGEAVVGNLPGLGQPGDGGEVVGRLVGERGVLQCPELVLGDQEAGGDVQRVQRLGDPDGEDDLFLVLGHRGRRHQGDQDDQCDQSKGPTHVSDLQTRHETFTPRPPLAAAAATPRRPRESGSVPSGGCAEGAQPRPQEACPSTAVARCSSGHSARRASAGMVRGAS